MKAAKNFLEVAWEGEPPSDSELLEALDRLLVAYHETPKVKFAHSELEPPRDDWILPYKEVGRRFKDYGYYSVTDPLELDEENAIMFGDGIDDIADITKEIRQTVWYSENESNRAAHWHFTTFYFEWGQHAREMSLYLAARLSK